MKNLKMGRGPAAWAALVFLFVLLFSGPALGVTEGGHGGEGGHGQAAGAGWKSTDTYRVLNFLVLAGALFFAVRKPAKQALAGRVEDIRKELASLEDKKKAAEAELAAFGERLGKMDAEAKAIVDDYVALGKAAKARILAEAEKAADRLRDQARRHMEHELSEARRALKEEILNRAMALSEERIRTGINEEDQNRLVGEYLEKVVAQ